MVLGGKCHCDTSKGYGYSLQPAGVDSSSFDYCVQCSGDNKVSWLPVQPGKPRLLPGPSYSLYDCPATNVLVSAGLPLFGACAAHCSPSECTEPSLECTGPPMSAGSLSLSALHERLSGSTRQAITPECLCVPEQSIVLGRQSVSLDEPASQSYSDVIMAQRTVRKQVPLLSRCGKDQPSLWARTHYHGDQLRHPPAIDAEPGSNPPPPAPAASAQPSPGRR